MSKKIIDPVPSGEFKLPTATPEQQPEAYSHIYNAKGPNALATIPTSSRAAALVFHPELDKQSLFTSDDVKITLDDKSLSKYPFGQTVLFFRYVMKKFTEATPHDTITSIDFSKAATREIAVDPEEFLALRGKEITPDNKKNTAREFKRYIETLRRLSLEFWEKNEKTKEKKHWTMNLLSATTETIIKKSRHHTIVLNEDFLNYIADKHYITNFPNAAFRIEVRDYPNAVSLADYLQALYNMNRGRKTQGIVSLGALLKRLSDVPHPDEIRDDRHLTRRIIDPLERDLGHLVDKGVLENWEWTNKKKRPLTDDQIKKIIEKGPLKVLSECYLSYTMKDYPEDSPAPKSTPKRCRPNPQKV